MLTIKKDPKVEENTSKNKYSWYVAPFVFIYKYVIYPIYKPISNWLDTHILLMTVPSDPEERFKIKHRLLRSFITVIYINITRLPIKWTIVYSIKFINYIYHLRYSAKLFERTFVGIILYWFILITWYQMPHVDFDGIDPTHFYMNFVEEITTFINQLPIYIKNGGPLWKTYGPYPKGDGFTALQPINPFILGHVDQSPYEFGYETLPFMSQRYERLVTFYFKYDQWIYKAMLKKWQNLENDRYRAETEERAWQCLERVPTRINPMNGLRYGINDDAYKQPNYYGYPAYGLYSKIPNEIEAYYLNLLYGWDFLEDAELGMTKELLLQKDWSIGNIDAYMTDGDFQVYLFFREFIHYTLNGNGSYPHAVVFDRLGINMLPPLRLLTKHLNK